MKFTIQLLFLLLFSSFARGAEVHHRSLVWNHPYKISVDQTQITIMRFEGSVFVQNTFIPEYQEFFELPKGQKLINVVISNIITQPIERSVCKVFEGVGLISDSISIRFVSIPREEMPRAFVAFIPIRKNPETGLMERVVSFELRLFLAQEPKTLNLKQSRVYASESMLATGRWFKFSTKESGVHRITFDELRSAGLDPATLNPKNIRMFGHGGGMLPEANLTPRYDDLAEIAILILGEEDGVFNTSDQILFYGESPHKWKYSASSRTFDYQMNLYSDFTYYFLTADKGAGKRITSQPSSTSHANIVINSFDDLQAYEKNDINLIKSGREWYGEIFEAVTVREFNFSVPNLLTDSLIRFRAVLAARSFVGSSFSLDVNGTAIVLPISGVSSSASYGDFARESIAIRNLVSTTPQIKVKITYNRSSSPSIGWLNRITLHSKRGLAMTDESLIFRSISSLGPNRISEFRLTGAPSTIQVWDITNTQNVMRQATLVDGSIQTFRLLTDQLREFIAFDPLKAIKPTFVERVTNQNLHAISTPDMIIVTNPLFLDEARRLAAFHTSHSGLVVSVTTTNQIYNEFSSGSQDISAIRDFAKMLFDRGGTNKPLKYLLLFGDASYDYKDKIKNNTNFVPCWQSQSSLHETDTYATDDFFGFLEDHEGTNFTDNIDSGIGRLPVSTVKQAAQMVDKIIRYASPTSSNMGEWRNNICFVADDEDQGLHMDDAEKLVSTIADKNKAFNIDKIYFDAYQQVRTPGGQRYPEVNEAINKRIEKGTLIMNYTGHGGVLGWGHERVLEPADINKWTNADKLPLFITATCEFAYYDDPNLLSAGELVLLNPNGGGIALFTTTRPTYASDNYVLHQRVYHNIFERENNQFYRLGDVLRLAKRNIPNTNSRKFILLGDPAVRLAIPTHKVVTTSLNQIPLNTSADTLKALSRVTFNGKIIDYSGATLSGFNGEVIPIVFDKAITITSLANDGEPPFSFGLQRNILYKGKSNVKNGLFEFSFIVPKDIAYKVGFGKISYYAREKSQDAHGYSDSVLVGGFNQLASIDAKGPDIALFINDENFRKGGTTHENPLLYAIVSDESGINTTGTGIGHDIIAVLDDQNDKARVLNDYYEADLDTYKKGKIKYPFFNLPDGEHKLRLKVWDIYNNSSEATTEFVVASSLQIALQKVLNYPNPFRNQTTFILEHNQAGKELEVQVRIFSFDGRLCKVLTDKLVPVGYRSEIFTWDGTDESGSHLGGGIYICQTRVKIEGQGTEEISNKLVIVR